MSNPAIIFQDLGRIPFKKAWDYQEALFQAIQDAKTGKSINKKQYLLFCEHPHVYTLGKSGDEKNLLAHGDLLKKIEATFYKINRGGDITYHGPGQLVGYPIIDLEYYNIGVREYIEKMEDAIIATIAEYGLRGGRKEGATGVWLDFDHPSRARKICAIGVRVSR
ncbi:MAG TPA: lipoyl(octanoyl) transferase LipB, partial [Bacteroidales bacterium]|nr:lipoyl(octanoyl) transferase LipB [Bacteroidales bacterium]